MNDGFHASNVPRERLTVSLSLLALLGLPNQSPASQERKHRNLQQGQGVIAH